MSHTRQVAQYKEPHIQEDVVFRCNEVLEVLSLDIHEYQARELC